MKTFLLNSGIKEELLKTINDDTLDILEQIEITLKYMLNKKRVSLYLSGGFDSRLIFYLLYKTDIEFDVYHIDPYKFEIDNEKSLVSTICEKYGITYTFLRKKCLEIKHIYLLIIFHHL